MVKTSFDKKPGTCVVCSPGNRSVGSSQHGMFILLPGLINPSTLSDTTEKTAFSTPDRNDVEKALINTGMLGKRVNFRNLHVITL
ncbi:hypothetical protein DPMN_048063 [Dreissena polymorpha]|uniref:Uncharacterized protein n=1 Tax=Dreissena polymorpha TaxID=45954 RepID=A0A9D4I205_DREPO|nr:hypothetical protein DPMN_048063 [Dreissena polymorpha]